LRFLAVAGLIGHLSLPPGLYSQSRPSESAPQQRVAPSKVDEKGNGGQAALARAQSEARELNSAAVRALSALQFKQAIELLKRAHRLVPADLSIAFNLGLACVKGADFPEAVEPLELAVTGPDKRDTAHFLLGTAYFETGQFQLAAEQFEFVRSQPEFAENALYFLEESYRKTGDGDRAEQAFLELMKLEPDSALVHKLLGTAYDAQSRFPEALAEFRSAAQADPGLPEVRFDAGLLCLKMHDAESARKWFEAELKLDSCYAAAHYYLGDIDRKASRRAPAAESFRKAIHCAPEYPEAHLALGIALQALGLNAEALPVLRRAVALEPGSSEAHFQLARSLAKAGRSEESRAEWKKAQDLADRQAANK
jgi:tetratricopeptide (TPR) repeat protein